MILSDFHCHTAFSSDSDTAPELMVEQAIRLGLRYLCITDHMDYLFPTQYEQTFTFDVAEYQDKLVRLKERYRGQITLLTGVELGLRNEPDICPPCQSYYRSLVHDYPWDFLIGSTHVLEKIDPYYPEYWQQHSAADGMLAYFESILENIRSYDMFQVYGHLDYLVRYLPVDTKDYHYPDYLDLFDEIFKLLIAQGRGIEVNTAGYKYGLPYAHPRPELLRRYRELGGEILTIGSDAHKPEHIAYDYKRAGEMLLSLGFRYYTIFQNQKPEFLPL
ncbi:MAG: histidinol-phosphatase HisJ family protein [Lachnospiraceae bacterium]|nr:histidinol-phosphatase HisJ family protein [Lachnospiraceae bacterium]